MSIDLNNNYLIISGDDGGITEKDLIIYLKYLVQMMKIKDILNMVSVLEMQVLSYLKI